MGKCSVGRKERMPLEDGNGFDRGRSHEYSPPWERWLESGAGEMKSITHQNGERRIG